MTTIRLTHSAVERSLRPFHPTEHAAKAPAMTDFASLLVADRGQKAHPIQLVDKNSFEDWAKTRPAEDRALLKAHRFDGKSGFAFVILPRKGDQFEVVSAVADAHELSPWCLAKLGESLPEGAYKLAAREPGPAALGWLLAQHRFDAYRAKKSEEPDRGPRVLVTGEPAKIDAAVREAEAVALVRDLVNTPAGDLGPAELEQAVRAQAERVGAEVRVTSGKELEEGYPLIAAVGRAASKEHAPRLIELEWGDPKNPRIAVVGKGVCFDSGGLDIKPSAGMRLMKKDMGGAAHALALAGLVMGAGLKVRLHCLVPAVENAIAGNAFRPGDVIRSRQGLTVEIGNTDAEGRLILADALALADEEKPDLLVDLGTLTGAARVALGPDLPPFYTNDETLAADIARLARQENDPLWRMPLWPPYDSWLDSKVANINNAPSGGLAGSITCALFLQRFVEAAKSWLHVDIYGWTPSAKPARPEGGECQAARAIYKLLSQRYA